VPEVGTILVDVQPFSDQDIGTIERVARSMNFDVVLSPRSSVDPTFAALAGRGIPVDASQALEKARVCGTVSIEITTRSNTVAFTPRGVGGTS